LVASAANVANRDALRIGDHAAQKDACGRERGETAEQAEAGMHGGTLSMVGGEVTRAAKVVGTFVDG
jgi:hypothetical protein